MPRFVTTIQIEADLHNRIAELRGAVSMDLRFSERSLGLAPMLGLLVDHWKQHPPDPEWLKNQAQLYPKRGRPPKHVAGTAIKTTGEKWHDEKVTRGHELLERRCDEGRPHRTIWCKRCSMMWSTWDFDRPPALCPKDGKVSSLYQPKVWTKIELLAAGFAEDEVAWCDQ
jgi:hypothetical protein